MSTTEVSVSTAITTLEGIKNNTDGSGATDARISAAERKTLMALLSDPNVVPEGLFNLNNMSDMVEDPANSYATALENLRTISSGTASVGIADLTASTTEVQVEQGKLEMINGIIKNAVNYLNNRARSLTQ